MRMRTISTSVLSGTMSNKIGFGRDAEDFLRSLGSTSNNEKGDSGINITAICPYADKCFEIRINVSGSGESERCEFVLLEELADRLDITPAAVTCALKGMEEGGYIERTLGHDTRYNELHITEKGKALVKKTRELFSKTDRSLFDGFTDSELDVYIRCLEKLQNNIRQYSDS